MEIFYCNKHVEGIDAIYVKISELWLDWSDHSFTRIEISQKEISSELVQNAHSFTFPFHFVFVFGNFACTPGHLVGFQVNSGEWNMMNLNRISIKLLAFAIPEIPPTYAHSQIQI